VALGQFGVGGAFELSEAVQLDDLTSAGKAHLERMRAARAGARWGEVIDILRLVEQQHGEQVIAVGPWRSVGVRDYCQLQLSTLPADALQLYRQQADAQAEALFADGLRSRDPAPLRKLLREAFCSSRGDDALELLAEMALESGRTAEARQLWERLIPQSPGDDGLPRQLAYPDAELDAAAVRARLILVSVLDGDLPRATGELKRYKELQPGAKGRFAGRDVVYAEFLEKMLADAAKWPPASSLADDWLSFAGDASRSRIAAGEIDLGAPAWPAIELGPAPASQQAFVSGLAQSRRVGEERGQLLSYHPLIVGNLLLVSTADNVLAYDVRTGKPAWDESAIIYPGDSALAASQRASYVRSALGVPRFTLTVHGNKLFARMGSQVTAGIQGNPPVRSSGHIVCLDLHAEGRLLWTIAQNEDNWAFEGTPVCDGEQVYVGLRRSEVNPQAHVACYDAETGQLRWRRFICSAQSPARGVVEECTHNLLTLAQGMLYYNTNLGCVAALDANDGQIAWIAKYPRPKSGDLSRPAAHFYRDLTPCVYDRGRVIVAPSDCDRIFALDAGSGRALWEAPHADDAVQLIGVAGGKLLASGDRLWWIDVETGKIAHVWPEQPSLRGFGRGLLAGDKVYWPTRDAIYVFDQQSGAAVDVMDLRRRLPEGKDAIGGNLVASRGRMVIATPTQLLGFTMYGQVGEKAEADGQSQTGRPSSDTLEARGLAPVRSGR
jgi:outer membrane protein assembly factor BamB